MQLVLSLVDFAVKALVVFVTFAACVSYVVARARRPREVEPEVRVKEVSVRWRHMAEGLRAALSPPKQRKKLEQELRAADKQLAASPPDGGRVFVVDFHGDMMATEAETLREEVNAITGVADAKDEVVVRLESSGGAVHSYGLAASQLARIRAKGIPLTVCVDKVAASGGYLMACVGSRIVAAPFAVVGSIGVVAPLPNVHRLLDRVGIDYEDVTAGRFKRPVTVLGEQTEEGKAKLREQLQETHALFKRFVGDMRPSLDIETVATGEHWYGTRAKELGLVDELATSDDYLMERAKTARVFEVECVRPRRVRERAASLMRSAMAKFEALVDR
ncbi:MAG: protease SohB [Polyangiaceae bacterium]